MNFLSHITFILSSQLILNARDYILCSSLLHLPLVGLLDQGIRGDATVFQQSVVVVLRQVCQIAHEANVVTLSLGCHDCVWLDSSIGIPLVVNVAFVRVFLSLDRLVFVCLVHLVLGRGYVAESVFPP